MRRPNENESLKHQTSEIELDGYETSASIEDFEDDDDDGSAVDLVDPKTGLTPYDRVNIKIRQTDYSESYLPDVQIRDTEDPFKNTELVLKFSHKIHIDALKWFINRVTAKKSQGGAELLLKSEPFMGRPGEGLVVHVTAAGWRLLEVAEKLEIKKMDYYRNIPRAFLLSDINCFMDDSMEISDILSPAEKQIVVMHELKNLHVHPGERHVPGYKNIKLQTGQSIFGVFIQKELISTYFALHQEEQLNKLKGHWFWEFWEENPYENIRNYFGDQTCLYFNFVAYYSFWLTIPAVIGMLMRLLPQFWFQHLVFYFCIINMLLVTIFLVMWQRYQSRLTYNWGTLRMNHWEDPRENHDGVLAIDPVTGLLQRRYPYYKCVLKTYAVSLPIILLCCAGAIWVMYFYLDFEDRAKRFAADKVEDSKTQTQVLFWKFGFPAIPVTIYAIIVFIFTKLYRWLATFLTEWENHRTETQHERHLVSKMVVFEASNSFSVLYYTAFIMNDTMVLQQRLFVLLGVTQFLMTLEQCIVPIVFRTSQAKMHEFLRCNRLSFRADAGKHYTPRPYPGLDDMQVEVLDKHDKRVQMSKVEEAMDPYEYEADFDEYLNLYLQFGYIFLFSSVYTPSAAFALLSNLLLLATSLFKRREVYQRALARRVNSIGAWLQAFEMMASVAVITNCALLAINQPLRDAFPDFSDMEWFMLFAFIEHLTLGLQYFVKKVCPKVPYKVKVAIAKVEYASRMAFKREQAEQTRRRLTHVFEPINRSLYQKKKNRDSLGDEKGSQTSSRERVKFKSSDDKLETSKPRPSSSSTLSEGASTTSKNGTNARANDGNKGKANATSKSRKNN